MQRGLRPDVTILLDVDVEVGLARVRERQGGPDRFEREDVGFFERVRAAYRERVAAEPGRFRVIDAGGDVTQVRRDVEAVLAALLESRP